jgi:flagellar motor switch protein FliN/FliY
MGEGSLSQDEIDALLQGADEASFDNSDPVVAGADFLSPLDRDLLADILNFSFGMAGQTLETLLSKSVKFSNATVDSKQAGDVSNEIGTGGAVVLMSNLSGPVNGRACLVLSLENASKIVTLLLGGLSTGALDSQQLQTLKNTFAPVMGNITVQMGVKLGTLINGSPLEASMAKNPKDLILPDGKNLVKTTLNLNIDSVGVFKAYYVISQATAEEILNFSKKGPQRSEAANGGMNVNIPQMGGGFGMQQNQPSLSQVGIKGVSFPSLASATQSSGGSNLNLLMDVQMSVTVELGRTKMYIKDILGLGEGSIIELDKLAGEPVDLLVNGKLIAKGEVVVIDENFGVRVTDIVSPTDRLKSENK